MEVSASAGLLWHHPVVMEKGELSNYTPSSLYMTGISLPAGVEPS